MRKGSKAFASYTAPGMVASLSQVIPVPGRRLVAERR